MLMQGWPPDKSAQVTRDNWQEPPYNRWAFWRMRELLPSQQVWRGDGPVQEFPGSETQVQVGAVGVTRTDGSAATLDDVLADSYTDAVVVLQDGRLVHEWYGRQGAPDRPHLLMSVTKSVVGCVAATLVEDGLLDLDRAVTDYLPELAGSGFDGALVHHLADMTSGVRFVEDYTDPEADVRRLDRWIGWQPHDAYDLATGLYGFLPTLFAEAPHGSRFLYRSSETDTLGWVCERAGGRRMAELVSARIWQPMGAEHDAEFLCDGVGTAVHDGGLSATARDLARFGQLLLAGGAVPGPDGVRQVLPPEWLRDAWAVDAQGRRRFAESPAEVSFPGGWYRHQFWFRPGDYGDVLLALGIHGQMVHVSRRTRTVCVKLSTWPQPQNPVFMQDTIRGFDALGGALTGREPVLGRRGLPGVVSGLTRHGGSAGHGPGPS